MIGIEVFCEKCGSILFHNPYRELYADLTEGYYFEYECIKCDIEPVEISVPKVYLPNPLNGGRHENTKR